MAFYAHLCFPSISHQKFWILLSKYVSALSPQNMAGHLGSYILTWWRFQFLKEISLPQTGIMTLAGGELTRPGGLIGVDRGQIGGFPELIPPLVFEEDIRSAIS